MTEATRKPVGWCYLKHSKALAPHNFEGMGVILVYVADSGEIVAAIDERISPWDEWSAVGVDDSWRGIAFNFVSPL